MNKALLQKTQWQQVCGTIQQNGLDPREFEQREVVSFRARSVLVSQLVHRTEGHSFTFDYATDPFICIARPGSERPEYSQHPRDWSAVLRAVRDWSTVVSRELAATNPWADFARADAPTVDGGLAATSNEPFAETEVASAQKIVVALADELHQLIPADDPNQVLIEERVGYLTSAIRRLGKRDWTNIAFSVFSEIAISLAADAVTAAIGAAWKLLRQTLGIGTDATNLLP